VEMVTLLLHYRLFSREKLSSTPAVAWATGATLKCICQYVI
jgi:hypothetical protein